MSKTRAENVAVIVAITSIVISMASLAFSIVVYRSSQVESMSVVASMARGGGEVRCRDFAGPAGVLQTPVEVVLSNTGDRALSIIRYEVLEISMAGGLSHYTHLDGGPISSEVTSLPITLGAGESRRILLWIGLRPSAEARAIVLTEQLCERPLSRRRLLVVLGRESIDLYGNTVRLSEYDDAISLSGPNLADATHQRFLLVFETGRGSKFTDTTSWYPFEDLL